MLTESNLLLRFRAEVIIYVYYVTNICLIKHLWNKTPYELLNNKSKLSYLRYFEFKCFVLNIDKDDL